MFLFQMVFMDTAVTIVTGSMAERWKFSAFIVYCFFMSCFLYPLFGHWAWGGGWLSQLGNNFGLGVGYADFRGQRLRHAVGGLCAAAGAIVLGPRIGKYNRDGTANAIPGHHMPMAILGCLIWALVGSVSIPARPLARQAPETCGLQLWRQRPCWPVPAAPSPR
jgi:Amt family ammonium transporter